MEFGKLVEPSSNTYTTSTPGQFMGDCSKPRLYFENLHKLQPFPQSLCSPNQIILQTNVSML